MAADQSGSTTVLLTNRSGNQVSNVNHNLNLRRHSEQKISKIYTGSLASAVQVPRLPYYSTRLLKVTLREILFPIQRVQESQLHFIGRLMVTVARLQLTFAFSRVRKSHIQGFSPRRPVQAYIDLPHRPCQSIHYSHLDVLWEKVTDSQHM
ncbi:hypothetical protein OPQ81_009835 [Rhizoctonia solani]|nr:hypothetical protein OPQ81_009835 [Rhizoctonia solani]